MSHLRLGRWCWCRHCASDGKGPIGRATKTDSSASPLRVALSSSSSSRRRSRRASLRTERCLTGPHLLLCLEIGGPPPANFPILPRTATHTCLSGIVHASLRLRPGHRRLWWRCRIDDVHSCSSDIVVQTQSPWTIICCKRRRLALRQTRIESASSV